MAEKPTTAKEYSNDQAQLVRATCLYVATILGDYIEDIVIVGGLVPSLLIDQDSLPEGTDQHVGTIDLDKCFANSKWDFFTKTVIGSSMKKPILSIGS